MGTKPESASAKVRTVLITGATSGFGLVACEVFLARGWRVLAAARRGKARFELFADLAQMYPAHFELLELDLEDPASIDRLSADIVARYALDGLINNAGYGLFGSSEDISMEGLRRQMEVNFFGTFRLTQSLLPNLRKQKGAVLTVSSVVGRQTLPLTGAYCASKFAVEGWMESLSSEIQPYGVDCYLLEPGGFPTKFGNALDWAVPTAESPYRLASDGYQELRRKFYDKSQKKSLRPVGEKMEYLLSHRPKALRHPIGGDALLTAVAMKFLPGNFFHRLSTYVMNRLQIKGGSWF